MLNAQRSTPPSLPVEMWLHTVFNHSYGIKEFVALCEIAPLLTMAENKTINPLKAELIKYLWNYDENQLCVEDIFRSWEFRKTHWGRLVYDERTKLVSFVLPFKSNVRCYHTLAASFYITQEGDVYTWGSRLFNKWWLGHHGKVSSPQKITALNGIPIRKIVLSDGATEKFTATYLITTAGEVYIHGLNKDGCYGLGHANPVKIPQKIRALNGKPIRDITIGVRVTFFIAINGGVYICRNNDMSSDASLGYSEHINQLQLMHVLNDNHIKKIVDRHRSRDSYMYSSDEYSSTFLIAKGKKIFARGNNIVGQLGLGHNLDVLAPHRITALNGIAIKDIITGCGSTFFIAKGKKIFACGNNIYGQLGLGHNLDVLAPQRITALDGIAIKDIITHNYSTLFIAKDGKIFACGLNDNGLLGLGHDMAVNVPAQIMDAKRGLIALYDFTIPYNIHMDGRVFYSYPTPMPDQPRFNIFSPLISFLKETPAAYDQRRMLYRLRANEPLGFLLSTVSSDPKTSLESAFTLVPAPGASPVYMTQWVLSHPMEQHLQKLLAQRNAPLEIRSSYLECEQAFAQLLDMIDERCSQQHLLLEHTKNSITPRVIGLALQCLKDETVLRLLNYLSDKQLEQRRRLLEPGLNERFSKVKQMRVKPPKSGCSIS